MMGRLARALRVAPVVAFVATTGCFATRNDVRVVQSDVSALRMEMLRNDTAQQKAIQETARLLALASDSLRALTARTVSLQGDVRGESRSIKEQLIQIQSLLGQSTNTILQLRREMEQRNAAPITPPSVTTPGVQPPAGSTTGATTGGATTGATPPVQDTTTAGPGPAQLLANGQELLRRGSISTAKVAFQELLTRFPTSDLAPDAQFFIGEALARERNPAGADAAYAAVVTKFPESPRAPTALYKRAVLFIGQGNVAQARPLLQQVISRYPRSVEADLAADQLAAIK